MLVALGVIMTPFVSDAYGHGLGFDVAPPISFEGMEVTVSTRLDPSDITAGEIDDANVAIRFYDNATDTTLEKVTYRVEVWRNDNLLARNLFYEEDGELNIEVRPELGCREAELSHCSKYFGSEHPSSPGALYVQNNGRPVISGPIFDKGGLYNVRVDIEGATSPTSLIDQVLSYDTFVSVAQDQNFVIDAYAEEIPVIVKTYYDEVDNFAYDTSDHSLYFEMPFDWDPEYIDLVQVVHEEIRIPRSFAPYAPHTSESGLPSKQLRGFVNGVELDSGIIVFDPFTPGQSNIIHFLVTQSELKRINDALGPSNHDSDLMAFELVPTDDITKNSVEFYLVDADTAEETDTTVNISWDSRLVAGDEIPFDIVFFDENKQLLRDVRYAYFLYDMSDDSLIDSDGLNPEDLGLSAFEGIDVQKITIPTDGLYRLDIRVYGQGPTYDQTYGGIGSALIELGSGAPTAEPRPVPTPSNGATEILIPDWVRSNAGWWAEGQITDDAFVSAIEYLIKEGIIRVPATGTGTGGSAEIPDWVRSNAGWWAEGQITDDAFVSGLQFLIENGIISI